MEIALKRLTGWTTVEKMGAAMNLDLKAMYEREYAAWRRRFGLERGETTQNVTMNIENLFITSDKVETASRISQKLVEEGLVYSGNVGAI